MKPWKSLILAVSLLGGSLLAQDVVTVKPLITSVYIAAGTGTGIGATATSSQKSTITGWTWNFGDGTSCTRVNTGPNNCYLAGNWHNYAQPGTYNATITVKDALGTTGTATEVVTALADTVTASLTLKSGNDQPIGLGVLYTWSVASSAGTLTSIILNCGDGTTQVQNLSSAPPTGTFMINGTNAATSASTCYPAVAGNLKPTITVKDSLGKQATAGLTPVNLTLPTPSCNTAYLNTGYQLPAWYLTPAPGPLTWTGPADVAYMQTQYVDQTVPITGWTTDGTNVTFTWDQWPYGVPPITAGQVIILGGFTGSTFFNAQKVTVLATGLSATQFEVAYPGATGASSAGKGTFSVLAQINTMDTTLGPMFVLAGYGYPFCDPLNAAGGTPPYTFTATGLPPGLTITQVTPTQALLGGGVTTPGTYTVLLTVTDSAGHTATLAPRTANVCTVHQSCP